MKKILYIILFTITIATSFTACTEENIAPKTNEGGNGAGSDDGKGGKN